MSKNEKMGNATILPLKEFISDSLTQIVDGIVDAQEKTKHIEGVVINQHIVRKNADSPEGIAFKSFSGCESTSLLNFDIAVTVSEQAEFSGEAKGKVKAIIGVLSGSGEMGVRGKSDKSKSQESRIKFTIPVFFPPRKQD